jgi:hypothetical protein
MESVSGEQDVALAQASKKIKDHAFFMSKAIVSDLIPHSFWSGLNNTRITHVSTKAL